MRLVAVSIIKNEADIIEAFVRHTLAWVDHHLIFDHRSTDGSREILHALRSEGLPLTLYTDDALGHIQQIRSNHLTRLAAQSFGADWILPLDADEILCGPDRKTLEACLAKAGSDSPLSLRLINYYPTTEDDSLELNPVRRLHYRQSALSQTKKIIFPAPLIEDKRVHAGKGNHVLFRDEIEIQDYPISEEFSLAHLSLRSPQHQALRVVHAELQKLSTGKISTGIDTHYRLGFQLLAENPEMFFSSVFRPTDSLSFQPITYHGSDLRYSQKTGGWDRVTRALLPYLECLAISHGQLVDGENQLAPTSADIVELPTSINPSSTMGSLDSEFSGFIPIEGWTDQEGPVPEAYLPSFHWGVFPSSRLRIEPTEPEATLIADCLTYSEGQSIKVLLNGETVHVHKFSRTNQRETLKVNLKLRSGENELCLSYSQSLVTDYDARQLAVIFLSLKIIGAE